MSHIHQGKYQYAKPVFIMIGLCFIATTGNLLAFEKNKTLHEWYNHYYLHRDKKLLVPALNYFYSAKFPASELKKMSIQGFFSVLFKQHPQQAVKWVAKSQLSPAERTHLLLALSTAGLTRQAIKWAKQDNWPDDDLSRLSHPEMPLEPAKLVIKRDIDIGFLWGAFKASGNKQYLNKIMDTLLQQFDSKNKLISELIIITAIKTLHYHRSNDSVIDDYYLARYANLSPKIQEELDILFAAHEGEDGSLDCD